MSAVRACVRLLRLGGVVLRAAWRIAALGRDPCVVVHEASREIIRLMRVELRVIGSAPEQGLIVANHLGYMDVILLAASAPAIFVAKREVAAWPVFGWFARRTGCIFVDRTCPTGAGRSSAQIEAELSRGRRVVLFPEGTSSGGAGVLPFRSSLLQPAAGRPVTIAAVGYALDPGDGDPSEIVCFWRDMMLVPHLARLMARGRVRATLAFESFSEPHLDRKALAAELRTRVAALRRRHPCPANAQAEEQGYAGLAEAPRSGLAGAAGWFDSAVR